MNIELENYLHTHIPLTSAMGIAVAHAANDKVILSAPFEPNINHKKTVFGGSLHAVATLSCWALLHLNLEHKHLQIVIAHSDASFLAPVDSEFQAECTMPEKNEWDRFLKTLDKKGKARITLQSRIIHNNRLAVQYEGVFVALLGD